jgi:hypothetical protein
MRVEHRCLFAVWTGRTDLAGGSCVPVWSRSSQFQAGLGCGLKPQALKLETNDEADQQKLPKVWRRQDQCTKYLTEGD